MQSSLRAHLKCVIPKYRFQGTKEYRIDSINMEICLSIRAIVACRMFKPTDFRGKLNEERKTTYVRYEP